MGGIVVGADSMGRTAFFYTVGIPQEYVIVHFDWRNQKRHCKYKLLWVIDGLVERSGFFLPAVETGINITQAFDQEVIPTPLKSRAARKQ